MTVRTFGDLLSTNAYLIKRCRFCHTGNVLGYRYGTRGAVCMGCCEHEKGTVIPAVATKEKAAGSLARKYRHLSPDAIHMHTGASLSFCEKAVEEAQ